MSEAPQATLLADGRYRLLDKLGQGGAAEVWRAWDERLEVERAVKLLTVAGARRSTLRRRLNAEARVLARIDHPHVLRILDVGQADQRDFIVMDLMPGGSLADRVQRHGPMPADQVVTAMLEVLSGLAAAHAHGVVHRDIKPQNLLVAADGRVVIADFGIALIEDGERRTRTGVAMGSFAYMPPEQRSDAKHVDHTADLYAVATTMFWLLTERTPIDLFTADADNPRYVGVPAELVPIIAWATRQDPAERPQDAATLATALRAMASSATLTRDELDPRHFPPTLPAPLEDDPDVDIAPTAPTAPPSPGRMAGSPWLLVGFVLGAIVILALVAVGWRRAAPTAPPVPLVSVEPVLEPLPPSIRPKRTPGRARVPVRRALPTRPAGRWAGAFDGRPAVLELFGPDDDLTGSLTVSFDGNRVATPVRGAWDADRGVLRLEDTADAADAGGYDARIIAGRLEGTFRGRYRDVVLPFTLRAESE